MPSTIGFRADTIAPTEPAAFTLVGVATSYLCEECDAVIPWEEHKEGCHHA